MPASWGRRAPLVRLQSMQQQTTFSQVVRPPWARGTTWSRLSSVRGKVLAPDPLPYEGFAAFVRSTDRAMPPYSEKVLPNDDLADICELDGVTHKIENHLCQPSFIAVTKRQVRRRLDL